MAIRKRKLDSLARFIKNQIDYDGSGGEDCPHCGKEITPMIYWIDHRSSLSGNIAFHLGFDGWSGRMKDVILEIVNNFFPITGDKGKDARGLAKEIIQELYGDNPLKLLD